jgi:hypothetical protein
VWSDTKSSLKRLGWTAVLTLVAVCVFLVAMFMGKAPPNRFSLPFERDPTRLCPRPASTRPLGRERKLGWQAFWRDVDQLANQVAK